MTQIYSLATAIILSIGFFSQPLLAQSAPAEKKVAQIKRVAASGNLLIDSLSKNLFKTETYQGPYTEQVPYEAQETYTVQIPYEAEEDYTVEIPYQVEEDYIEQVPYYEQETYTENVPYTVEVPYTDTETEYRQEHRCEDVTRYREECRYERKCYLIPGSGGQQCRSVEECGTNVHGQRICKTREVCSDNPAQERCDNQRVCENEPYTDRECKYVQVPYERTVTKYRTETRYKRETRTRTVTRYRSETRTRTVTKYRSETRTRTVTKYRSETRTRTVTKYREEQRCCKPLTREVFDRQLQYQVEVSFPQEAQLIANESENINITLISADETSAKVGLQVVNSVFGYKIANQTVSGAQIRVELALVPKFDLSNSGVATIKDLKIEHISSLQRFQVSFTDTVNSRLMKSTYSLVISDLTSGVTLETAEVKALGGGKLGAVLNTMNNSQSKIKATLHVKRTGAMVVDSEIGFELSSTFEKSILSHEDLASLADAKKIDVTLAGTGLNSALLIRDETKEFADVDSQYQISLDLRMISNQGQSLYTKTFTREELKKLNMMVSMASVINVDKVKRNALKSRNKIGYSVVVLRKGSNLLADKSVKVFKSGLVLIK